MRCAAPCSDRSVYWRSWRSPTDRQCLRNGKIEVAGKWFCYQHAQVWRAHYEIVERIRAL